MAPVTEPMSGAPRAVVLGDLVLDVVLRGSGPLRWGTDVAGRIVLRQGGSAASTARVLAREGVQAVLVTAVGGDAAADALVDFLRGRGVEVHPVPIASTPGRLGVLVEPDGERSFVSDRGPIIRLQARHLRAAWFRDAQLLHLPVYSLLGQRLAATAERAARLARATGARVSIDLASAGYLRDYGAGEVLATIGRIGPDLLFANLQERETVLADVGHVSAELTAHAPLVVLKEGARGARAQGVELDRDVVLARQGRPATDTTGAGDAFDAGFLAAWLERGAPLGGPGLRQVLSRAMAAGYRAADRELRERRAEFAISGLIEVPARGRIR